MIQFNEEERVPFSDTLTAIFDGERVTISALYRLSDLAEEDFNHFQDRWEQTPVEKRRIVARHLADIMENNFQVDFVRVLRYLLYDADEEVRIAGLDGLWDTTHLSMARPIIRLMEQDPSDKVRAAAAATLAHFILMAEWGQINDRIKEPVVSALLGQWDTSTSLPVRRAVLEALGAAYHPRVPEIIESGYQSGPHELQLSAIFAMGNSADARWLPTILAEMSSPYEEMRAEAARAAGNIGRSSALTNLQDLLFDEDEDVRLAAIAALGEIGSDRAREMLHDLRRDVEEEDERMVAAIDEALEEMDWLAGGVDLSVFDFEDGDVEVEPDEWDSDGPVA